MKSSPSPSCTSQQSPRKQQYRREDSRRGEDSYNNNVFPAHEVYDAADRGFGRRDRCRENTEPGRWHASKSLSSSSSVERRLQEKQCSPSPTSKVGGGREDSRAYNSSSTPYYRSAYENSDKAKARRWLTDSHHSSSALTTSGSQHKAGRGARHGQYDECEPASQQKTASHHHSRRRNSTSYHEDMEDTEDNVLSASPLRRKSKKVVLLPASHDEAPKEREVVKRRGPNTRYVQQHRREVEVESVSSGVE